MKTAPVAFLFAFAVPLAWAQSSTALTDIANGESALAAQNMVSAQADFAAATTADPTNQTAVVLSAITTVLDLPQQTAGENLMNEMGLSSSGRSVYDFSATLPFSSSGVTEFPVSFDANTAVSYLQATALPVIETASAELASVTSQSFTIPLSAAEADAATAVTIDYGDIQMCNAIACAMEVAIDTANGTDFDATLANLGQLSQGDLVTLGNIVAANPNLGLPASAASRLAAQQSLLNAIACFNAAVIFITTERPAGAPGTVHLFMLTPENETEVATLQANLGQVKAAITGYVPVGNQGVMGTLAPLFTPEWSLRTLLPPVTASGSFNFQDIPDPTLGGLLSGASSREIGAEFGNPASAIQVQPYTPSNLSFTTQPSSLTITNNTTVAFTAAATGSPAPTYQWKLGDTNLSNGGNISGATSSTLLITGATTANAGNYSCVASNESGTATSSAATLAIDAKASDAANPGRLANLSVNSVVASSGANSGLSAGFVSGGAGTSGSEQLMIRALGPLLGTLGLTGVLPDPTLTVVSQVAGVGTVAQNSGWGSPAGNVAAVTAAQTALSALALTNTNSADAALVTTLPANGSGYSVDVIGKAGTAADSGTVVAEVWDDTANYALTTPRLVNLSCRQLLPAKTGSLTAGFVIGGSTAKTVLIRAMGPTLASFGLSPVMPDPELQVFTLGANAPFAANANWGGNPLITQVNNQVFAFNPASSSSADSELVVTLPPGAYTAQATSASGAAGLVQVEVFEVP